MRGWRATQRCMQAVNLYECVPAATKITIASQHRHRHSQQGAAPILVSTHATRSREASGVEPTTVSSAGHALVDLAGVARLKKHGEIAAKGLRHYVSDDDDASVKFPSAESARSEIVRASRSSPEKRMHQPQLAVRQQEQALTSCLERRCSHQKE